MQKNSSYLDAELQEGGVVPPSRGLLRAEWIVSALLLMVLFSCSRSEVKPEARAEAEAPGLLRPMTPLQLSIPSDEVVKMVALGADRFLAGSRTQVAIHSKADVGWEQREVLVGDRSQLQIADLRVVPGQESNETDLLVHNISSGNIELYRDIEGSEIQGEPLVLRRLGPRGLMATLGESGALVTLDEGRVEVRGISPRGELEPGKDFSLEGRFWRMESVDLAGEPNLVVLGAIEGKAELLAVDPRTGSQRRLLESVAEITEFAIGDVNGDGYPDLVVGHESPEGDSDDRGAFSILVNAGDGSFRSGPVIVDIPRAKSIVLGDFDGDGRTDVGWTSANWILGVSYQEADGTFSSLPVWSDHSLSLGVVTIGGHAALLSAGFRGGVLIHQDDGRRLWAGRRGTLLPGKPFSVLVSRSRDGRESELVVSHPDLQAISMVRGGKPPRLLDVEPTMPGAMLEVDFGCGPGSELVVLDSSQLGGVGKVVHRGEVGPTVRKEFEHKTALAAEIADFDGDGRPDIVTAGFSVGAHVEVIWNRGDCSFEERSSYSIPRGFSPMALTTGDFLGDGRRLVAVADYHAHTVWVLAIEGGEWRDISALEVGQGPIAIGACEWDGRPGEEILVASRMKGSVEIYGLGENGASSLVESFSTEFPFYRGGTVPPRALLAGDFDGDGRCDFISGGTSGTYLGVMSRNGRTADLGVPLLMGGGTTVDIAVAGGAKLPTLVFVSSGDDVLMRAEMEFAASSNEADGPVE